MNDMKELEAQLCSWTPRRPSPAIERKLFRAGRRRQHLPSSESAPSAVRFAWLAPVTAALLLACIVLNQHGGPTPVGATNTPMVAMIMSNQSVAVRLNAAIVVARVGEKTASAALQPAVITLLSDKSDAVKLWGLKAAKFVLPAVLMAAPPPTKN